MTRPLNMALLTNAESRFADLAGLKGAIIDATYAERGFVSHTSAAILVLQTFLITMNATVIFLCQKFEKKW